MKNIKYTLISLAIVYACFNFYAYSEIDNLVMSHNAIVTDINALRSQIGAYVETNKNLEYRAQVDILFSKDEIDSMKIEIEANKKRINECSDELEALKVLRNDRLAQIQDANRIYSKWLLVRPNTNIMILI